MKTPWRSSDLLPLIWLNIVNFLCSLPHSHAYTSVCCYVLFTTILLCFHRSRLDHSYNNNNNDDNFKMKSMCLLNHSSCSWVVTLKLSYSNCEFEIRIAKWAQSQDTRDYLFVDAYTCSHACPSISLLVDLGPCILMSHLSACMSCRFQTVF